MRLGLGNGWIRGFAAKFGEIAGLGDLALGVGGFRFEFSLWKWKSSPLCRLFSDWWRAFEIGLDLGKSGFSLGLWQVSFTLTALTLQAAVFRSLS